MNNVGWTVGDEDLQVRWNMTLQNGIRSTVI